MFRNLRNTWKFAEGQSLRGGVLGGLYGEGDFLEEDDSEDGQYEEEGYSSLIRFIDLIAPCGGCINYSGCIHVNFVDVDK